MDREIITIFGFDMETDIGSWTPYYNGLVQGTPRLLEVLSEENVKATFLFTGEAARSYPGIVKDVMGQEHEIGCHTLCHETIGDELFPIPGLKPVLPEEVFFRIKTATGIIESITNEKALSFRSPRLWGSTAVVNALEELGYWADLSYPMYYYRDRIKPYHPDKNDWTREGTMKIVEIPNFADMTIVSTDPYGRDRDQWPLFRTEGAESLMTHVNAFVDYCGGSGVNPAVLCFYLHPWEFVRMPEGLISYGEGSVLPDQFLIKNCGDYALEQFQELIRLLKGIGSSFCTARDFAGKGD